MQVYSIHIRGRGLALDSDVAVIKEGFSWPAFVFNFFWMLWHRHWVAGGAILFVITAIFASIRLVGGTGFSEFILCAAWFMTVGAFANDFRRYCLERQGYLDMGQVLGETPDDALYLYLKESLSEA